MLNRINMKNFVLILLSVVFISFGLGTIIYVNSPNKPSFFKNNIINHNNSESNSIFKGDKNDYNINEEKIITLENLKLINAETSSTDINIIPEDRSDIKVHLIGSITTNTDFPPKLETTKENDTLKINVNLSNKTSKFINLSVFKSTLSLNIYLPKSYLEAFKLNSTSGNISIKDLNLKKLSCGLSSGDTMVKNVTTNTFDFKSVSGKLQANSFFTKDGIIESSSGDIDLKLLPNNSITDNLKINSTSGKISVTDLKAEKLTCETSSGDAKFSNSTTNLFYFKSTSGKLQANPFSAKDGTIGTSSGDIEIKSFDKNTIVNGFKINSTSGRISITDFKLQKLACETSSGDVKIGNVSSDSFSFKSTIGRLEATSLSTKDSIMKTSSGDIDIESFTGKLSGEAISGHINVNYNKFDNDINLRVSSGDIKLALPKESEFSLSGKASSGDISCKFPIIVNGTQKRNYIEGTVKSDKNKITIDSTSGNVNIYSKN